MKQSLQKSYLLKNKRDIRKLFDNGQWIKGKYYTIVFMASKKTLFLFTSSKYNTGAVDRNKKKRLSREIIRKIKYNLDSGQYAFILGRLPKNDMQKRLQADIYDLLISNKLMSLVNTDPLPLKL